MKVCIVGASGKLGRYMVRHALVRGHDVVAVCRAQSVGKLADFQDRIAIVPGATNDREVIAKAVAGCKGVRTVLVPWGVQQYSSGTAQAVLDLAEPAARLVFSCGWHIAKDGRDRYSRRFLLMVAAFVGDPLLESNRTRRVDFALFMVHALENDALIHEAPAIVSRASPSALAHATAARA